MAQTYWAIFSLMEILGIIFNLDIIETWEYHYMQPRIVNYSFGSEQLVLGIAYHMTYVALGHFLFQK